MDSAPPPPTPPPAPEAPGSVRVLLIEDNLEVGELVCELLRDPALDPVMVLWAQSIEAGFRLLSEQAFDILLVDLFVHDGAGLANVDRARETSPETAVIVLSAIDDERVALEAVQEGVQDYLVRTGLTRQLLVRSIRYAVERQRVETQLLQAQENYRGIFEHIVEGIFQTSPDGHYLSANPALARIYGYETPDELIRSVTDIQTSLYVDPTRRSEFVRLMENSDVVTGFVSQVRRRDGTVIWISENVRAIRDAAGRLLCYEGTVEDITERRQAEESLRNSEALYHSLVETLPQNIFRKDLQGRFTFANRRFCQTVGRSLEELLGRTDADFFPAELAGKYHQDDQLVLQTGVTYETVEAHQPPVGDPLYVQVVKTPLRDAYGSIIGIQGIFWDITEKRRAEERERQTNAELARGREELRLKNEEMAQDLRMAREIQLAILPQQYPVFLASPASDVSLVEFQHRYTPSGEVGGDFFNVFPLSNSCVGVFLCDVMGHGVRSALVTAMVRALVEELKPIADDPGQLLTRLNHDLRAILKQSGSPTFTTAVYLTLDLTNGSLRYASAGHPKQILVHPSSGTVEFLSNPPGKARPPLGLMDNPTYLAATHTLSPGDRIFLFTDGLFEVEGPDQQYFTIDLLAQVVQRHAALPLSALLDATTDEVRRFSKEGTFEDDVCLLAAELRGFMPSQSAGDNDI